RGLIGGSCPNIACLPSKNVIRTAQVAHLARNAADYGISTGTVSVDMAGVRQRKREMVQGMVDIHERRFAAPNIEFLLADGRLVGPRTVEARLPGGATRRVQAARLF